jgi:hypothetical protein
MPPTILVFSVLLDFLQQGIEKIKDPRSKSNATKFKVGDAMLSAFSMFFMQNQSFLEYQRQIQSRSGKDNVQSIFGVETIPCDQQIRNILDLISANSVSVVFEKIYQFLQMGKHLQRYSGFQMSISSVEWRENANGKSVFTGFERTSNRSLPRRQNLDARSSEAVCGQSKLGK